MNRLSSFLLILLISHLFHRHSALSPTKLEEFGIDKGRESSMDLDVQERSFHGDDNHQFHRKELHEVHSGPNPISNSVPRRRSQTKLRRISP